MLSKLKSKLGLGLGVTVAGTGAANAALPTALTDALTQIQTDGTALIDAGWPVFVAITGGLILIKLGKKVIGKVT
jgi:hypothetical protein